MTALMARMAELAGEGIGQPVASRARELLAKIVAIAITVTLISERLHGRS